MITVLSVFGSRPEAIKMAPVVRELAAHPTIFRSVVCTTGQHRDVLDQVLAFFDVMPDYDLDLTVDQTLAGATAGVLNGLDPVLDEVRPDWVLVQGDTTTAIAASLAACYRGIPVGHVEAGLRTEDKHRPFPEEIHRRIAGVVADLHFAPTEWAADNLRHEDVPEERIVVTGNTVIDAVQQVAARPFDPTGSPLADLPRLGKRLILVTAHHRENLGRGISEICAALRTLATERDDVHIVYPVHRDPSVWEPVHAFLGDVPNVTLLPPLDYQSLVWLLRQCYFVISDSGVIQEEASEFGKPVLVLREATERLEGLAAGTILLVGADRDRLLGAARRLLIDPIAYDDMADARTPYGDGRSARRIAEALSVRVLIGDSLDFSVLGPRAIGNPPR